MGIIQMLKMRMNRSEIYNKAEFWDSKADHQAGDSVSMWQNNNLNHFYDLEQKQKIEPCLAHISGLSILDIGCGTGRMARHFARQGATVKAFDFSSKSIAVAQELGTSDGAIRYEVQSVFDLDEYQGFDMAFTWGVLTVACNSETELYDALKKIHRALKKDGELLLLEPIHKNFLRRVLKMNLKSFIHCMKRAGFEIHDQKQLHFWPARILLCYLTIPMWITKPIYNMGQFFMRFIPNSGDYTILVAKKKVRQAENS